jgi:hypothetical protein
LVVCILEDLKPSRVGAPDLHVVGLSSVFDVPRLVVQLSLDGQGFLVEIPNLSVSSIFSLDDHVSVVDQIEVSV